MLTLKADDYQVVRWDGESKYWYVKHKVFDEMIRVRQLKLLDGMNVTIYHNNGRVSSPRPVYTESALERNLVEVEFDFGT